MVEFNKYTHTHARARAHTGMRTGIETARVRGRGEHGEKGGGWRGERERLETY